MPAYDSKYDSRVNSLLMNVKSLFQTLEHRERDHTALQAQVQGLQNTVADLVVRNASMQQELLVLKARVM